MRPLAISIPIALFAALAVFGPGQFTMAQSSTATKTTGAKKSAAAKPTTPSPPAAKSTAAKSTPANSTTAKAAAAKSTAANRTAAKSGAKQNVSSYHPPQQQPTPDRYKEIQQALADRGYFGGPIDGNWGPSSMDALKRFQHDQNLLEDGKVGSLSLIALGLGPKRGAASANPVPMPPPSAPPSPTEPK